MKGQAVPSGEQHQRKEARRKERVTMPKEIPEEHDWEPETCRAAIYLCGLKPCNADETRDVPPIYQQRVHCRCAAAIMHAEVVREYVDESTSMPWRPELHSMVLMASEDRTVSCLIVYSKDLLARDCTEMFDVAWRLGVSGTSVIAIDENDLSAWTER